MFYRTAPGGKDGHTHLCYVNQETGAVFGTSEMEKHKHPIEQREAVEEVLGMDGSVYAEGAEAGIYVLGGGAEKDKEFHDHGILDLSVEFVSEKTREAVDENASYRLARNIYSDLKEYNSTWTENKEIADRYKRNQQWKSGDEAKLDFENRAHISANFVRAMINTLVGFAIEFRTDWYVMPVEGGDVPTADILTKALKYVSENCGYPLSEILTFEDQASSGAGIIHWYVDFDENIEGDIKLDRMLPDKAMLGPHEKHDLSDMEAMVFTQLMSERKFKQMWPDKYKEMVETGKGFEGAGGLKEEPHIDGSEVSYDRDGGEEVSIDNTEFMQDPEFMDRVKRNCRVAECWIKEFIKIPMFVEIADDGMDVVISAKAWEDKDVTEAKTIEGISFVSRKGHEIRRVTICGNITIADGYPDLILNRFPIEVAFAGECGKHISGKITDVIPMQDMINKSLSLSSDILNKMQNFMWFIFPETFDSPKDEADFRENSAKPGYVCKVNNKDYMPERVETHTYPAGLVGLLELATNLFRQISLVNNESQGVQANGSMSGKLALEMKRSAVTGNRILFDRFSFMKQRLGKVLVQLIPKIYSPARMARILNNMELERAVKEGQISWEEANQAELEPLYTLEQIQQIWDELDISKYDVKVWESPYNPTIMEANFETTADLARQGVMIPPEVLIDASSLPNKRRIKEMIAQQREQEAQIEQGKQNTEIQKTIIANQEPAGPVGPVQQ